MVHVLLGFDDFGMYEQIGDVFMDHRKNALLCDLTTEFRAIVPIAESGVNQSQVPLSLGPLLGGRYTFGRLLCFGLRLHLLLFQQ